MKYWFTADMHLNHEEIIKFCNRPFKSVEEMNKRLIANWNARVKKDDIVFHLGDFCFRYKDKTAAYYEKLLNGKIIHVQGSHDLNNTCRTPIEDIIITYGGRRFLLSHEPFPTLAIRTILFADWNLCGHVHKAWLFDTVSSSLPAINVGVDCWEYYPINITEINKLIAEINAKYPNSASNEI